MEWDAGHGINTLFSQVAAITNQQTPHPAKYAARDFKAQPPPFF